MISENWFLPANRRHVQDEVRRRLGIYHGFEKHPMPHHVEILAPKGVEYVILHRVVNNSSWNEAMSSFLHYSDGLV